MAKDTATPVSGASLRLDQGERFVQGRDLGHAQEVKDLSLPDVLAMGQTLEVDFASCITGQARRRAGDTPIVQPSLHVFAVPDLLQRHGDSREGRSDFVLHTQDEASTMSELNVDGWGAFEQTIDVGARMALLHATSVAASGAGEQVGVTRQLLEAGYSALSRPSGARQVG